jgi:uncharacterized protein (DUF433 family)
MEGNHSAAALVMQSMHHPRGRYTTERAAQLSGIPRSTLYAWHRARVYVPDFVRVQPMGWSYRDLVLLRVLAWLRNDVRVSRPIAAERVHRLKQHLSGGGVVTLLQADRDTLAVDGDVVAPIEGKSRLFTDMLRSFDFAAAVEDFGTHDRLWGPDLVTPSVHTYISPWVLGGEPCIERSRIPSASVYALHTERGLELAHIVQLYPGLDVVSARDAWELESRLRRAVRDRAA